MALYQEIRSLLLTELTPAQTGLMLDDTLAGLNISPERLEAKHMPALLEALEPSLGQRGFWPAMLALGGETASSAPEASPQDPEASPEQNQTTEQAASESPNHSADTSPEADTSPTDTSSAEADGFEFDADDFEFEDPEHATVSTVNVRLYDLSQVSEQDRLLTDLARNAGVQGALLCDNKGQPVRVRLPRGGEEIAKVVGVSARMLRRPWRLLSMQLGAQHISVRPLGDHLVALVTEKDANMGRILGELQLLRAQ